MGSIWRQDVNLLNTAADVRCTSVCRRDPLCTSLKERGNKCPIRFSLSSMFPALTISGIGNFESAQRMSDTLQLVVNVPYTQLPRSAKSVDQFFGNTMPYRCIEIPS